MDTNKEKLQYLKNNNPIMRVASQLGFNVSERGSTVAIHCFNNSAHSRGDKSPSLVLQPNTNTFECKSCGVKGDVLDFIQAIKKTNFKDAVLFLNSNFFRKSEEIPLPVDPGEYWKSRGISEEMKKIFQLKLTDEGVYIPLENGSIKRRNFKPWFDTHAKEWKFPKFVFTVRKGKCLFKAGQKEETIFITEGELDAIKLHQETGFCVISDTTGASSFDDLYLEDSYIKDAKKIYIIPDNDKAGREGAGKKAELLGVARCSIISLPEGKDITEYFVTHKHTAEEFKKLIDSAQPVQSLHAELTTSYEKDAINFGVLSDDEMLKKKDKTEVLHFGIPKMDEGPYKIDITPGFICVAAAQGIGKSWMMLHLSRVFYINHSKKSVILSLEMSKETLKERALQSFNHLTQEQYENGEDLSKGIAILKESKLVIHEFGIEDASKVTPEELKSIVDYYYSQGYRVFQFDHLHQISGMSDGAKEKEVSDKWALAIKSLTSKYKDIWFFAYAQTTKEASRSLVTKEGIRYGVRFIDLCDMFFSLNKPALFTNNKNLSNVDIEEQYKATDSRLLLIYLGKARYSTLSTHVWKVIHSRTGNFVQPDLEYSDEKPSEELKRKTIQYWSSKTKEELMRYIKSSLRIDERLSPEKISERDILIDFFFEMGYANGGSDVNS